MFETTVVLTYVYSEPFIDKVFLHCYITFYYIVESEILRNTQ
jgi:hypothetical protein